ncbi:hypothetical protein WGM54_03645 [Paenibacillus polymyxa]|uniref:hypothetical protein n=1 Tax=Paenibacillus polymyxa TaxID=1406 RepID=UPI00307CDBCF
MSADNEQVLKQIYEKLKSETDLIGYPVGGGEFEDLSPADLMRVDLDEHERLILVMKTGNYFLLGKGPTFEERVQQFPGFIKVGEESAINLSSVTKIDYETKTVWCGEKRFLVEVAYWDNFINEYKSRQ